MQKENIEIFSLIILGSVLLLLLVFFVIFVIVRYKFRQQKHSREKLLMQSNFQQELLRAQIEIQEHTLKAISQEIHDNIGQILSLAKLNLNTPIYFNDQKLVDTRELVGKAIADLRNLSYSLHSDVVIRNELEENIKKELQILENSGQFKATLNIKGESGALDEEQKIILFRICQEALHNIVKHAEASEIYIELHYQKQQFVLTVQDNGKGFNLLPFNDDNDNIYGIGIKSMHNRAKLINADFRINSTINQGTVLSVRLPL